MGVAHSRRCERHMYEWRTDFDTCWRSNRLKIEASHLHVLQKMTYSEKMQTNSLKFGLLMCLDGYIAERMPLYGGGISESGAVNYSNSPSEQDDSGDELFEPTSTNMSMEHVHIILPDMLNGREKFSRSEAFRSQVQQVYRNWSERGIRRVKIHSRGWRGISSSYVREPIYLHKTPLSFSSTTVQEDRFNCVLMGCTKSWKKFSQHVINHVQKEHPEAWNSLSSDIKQALHSAKKSDISRDLLLAFFQNAQFS